MEKLYIISVEDQRDVLDAISNDLSEFKTKFEIELCESAEEALELMDDIDSEGDFIAVIISDHVMPGTTGVEFLTEVSQDSRFKETRKILLTGLATHEDTIEAINSASINNYIEKPWKKEKLINTIKSLLTQFIMDKGIDYSDFEEYLDPVTLMDRMRNA
ncbi:MAG: response regulator [Bacteroidota bacterium]